MAYLSRAACAALLVGVGVMATTDAGLAAVFASITLASSGGGVYDYDLVVGPPGVAFEPGQTITLSGLSGVTGASVSSGSDLAGNGFSLSSFTSTSVVFEESSALAELNAGTYGTLVVDSSALTTGTVDFTINITLFGVGTLPQSGTVGGPVGTAVPERSTWAMILLGLAGLGFAGRRARGGFRSA